MFTFREEGRTPPTHHRTQSIDIAEFDATPPPPMPKFKLQKHDLLSVTVDDPSYFQVF